MAFHVVLSTYYELKIRLLFCWISIRKLNSMRVGRCVSFCRDASDSRVLFGADVLLMVLDWIDGVLKRLIERYLVDPASSHMLCSRIKPCMSKYEHVLYCETADSSLYQL